MRAFRVAYDGRPYHGFQRQPDVPTVEGRLLAALRALDVLDADEETPPGYAAAGRTDAGVSAVAQTVAFEAPEWLSPATLTSELPASVRAWASADAPAEFHATHHARSREYTYYLHAPDADLSRTRAALDRLAGSQDFHNLTPDETGTKRDLSAAVSRDGPLLVLSFRAGGFARQLVRRLVSVVAEVARGESSLDRIDRVLSPEPLSGPEGVPPAPAYPLVLAGVEYPDLPFESDPDAVPAARELFDAQRTEYTVRARVAETIAENIDH
ncbi:tRNA pseudouridine(38-40) synthase TruA [Halovenus sp. WSH3]|uniref:tRNA pseudouridine synthase A n=2 Tax=Halovenus carboxidivorans TaxID=2692199 RepID=A0A6B0T1U9_9EURY|nr:tRNA pseudouridine(38-40) synthase TruA [Halovenus carboxidivorans]MXR52034.1 tRNA pseudouridine(38-40) synthase TruA [Halovenus carboxidivorans]